MKTIRLLYVSSSLQSIHEYRILRKLSEDPEIDVTVATCQSEDVYPDILALAIPILKSREHSLDSRIPGLRRLCNEYRHWRFPSFLRKVIRYGNYDLIHSGWLPWDSYEVLKTGFHPFLAMSWGSDVLNNPDHPNPHTSRRLLRRMDLVAHGSDAMYSDARYVADTISGLTGVGRNKINVFPQLGIDTDLFRPDADLRNSMRTALGVTEKTVLLGMRRMRPVYGVEDLIRAMPAIADRYPEVVLLLLGDGYLRKHLTRVADNIGEADRIRFLGAVANEELPGYLNAADLYISTSLSDGSSLSLLEAMSCGLSAAVTDVPSNLEWISDGVNGWIAQRGNPESISGAVRRALSSGDSLRSFGRRNRHIAEEKIDITRNYEKLKGIYKRLVGTSEGEAH